MLPATPIQRTILCLAFLLFCGVLAAQPLQPGFSKTEFAELLRISARAVSDTAYSNKLPAPERFRQVYRSAEVGLDNRWDLWTDGQTTAVISIRGTTKKQESWLENFYAAMVPARGTLTLPGNRRFDYQLAPQPDAAVHVGWLVGMAAMADDVKMRLDSATGQGMRNLLIMGHSQGGALAYLLTAHLRHLQQRGQLPADLRIKTYCSAAPKPGNLAFAYAYEASTFGGWAFNVVNSADWVPETPFSIQSVSDFNRVNPFRNARAGIRRQRFPTNVALLHVYNRLSKTGAKASRTYRKFLGEKLGKQVAKLLPGLEVPDYLPTQNYMRAGTPIALLADSAYFRLFPDTSGNVFIHHLHAGYLYLLERLPDTETRITLDTQAALDGTWDLVALGSGRALDDSSGRKAFLQLDIDKGRVAGSTGCNRFTGGLQWSAGALRFAENMALTRMACPGSVEQLFLDALRKARRYTLSNNYLVLMDDGQELMRLARR